MRRERSKVLTNLLPLGEDPALNERPTLPSPLPLKAVYVGISPFLCTKIDCFVKHYHG